MEFRDCRFHHVSLFSKSPQPQFGLIGKSCVVVTGNEPTPLDVHVSSAGHEIITLPVFLSV